MERALRAIGVGVVAGHRKRPYSAGLVATRCRSRHEVVSLAFPVLHRAKQEAACAAFLSHPPRQLCLRHVLGIALLRYLHPVIYETGFAAIKPVVTRRRVSGIIHYKLPLPHDAAAQRVGEFFG